MLGEGGTQLSGIAYASVAPSQVLLSFVETAGRIDLLFGTVLRVAAVSITPK